MKILLGNFSAEVVDNKHIFKLAYEIGMYMKLEFSVEE
jgi:hypothetical protein